MFGISWSPAEESSEASLNLWRVVVTEQEIEKQVIEIVGEQMGVDTSEITRETSFVNDLNADSLDTVELVMEFEDRFETSIPDDKAEQIKTVGEAIDFIVEAKKAAKA
jgi:acyl carrier protein